MLINTRSKFLNAFNHHKNGDFIKAELAYIDILNEHPNDFDTLHHLGIMYTQKKDFGNGIKFISRALKINPKFYIAYNNRGIAYRNQNQIILAINDFKKSIQLKANYADPYYNLSLIYVGLGKMNEALKNCNKTIELNSKFPEAHNIKGIIYSHNNKLTESLKSFNNAISLNPKYFEAFNNRGSTFAKFGKTNEAIKDYLKAITINPNYAEAQHNLSEQFFKKNELKLALHHCELAIILNKKFEDAYNIKGNILLKLKKTNEAIENFKVVLSINPNNLISLNGLANSYADLGEFEKAISLYKKAVSINKNFSDAFSNMGLAFYNLRNNDEAIRSLTKSISLNPKSPETFLNLGNTYLRINKINEAIKCYENTIILNPKNSEAYYNKASALVALKKYNQAKFFFKKTLNLKSDFKLALSSLIYIQMKTCDWDNYSKDYKDYKLNTLNIHFPFTSLSILNSPHDQKIISETYVNNYFPEKMELGQIKEIANNKIIVAYFSNDFGDHPVTHLISELIERHSRNDFEVIGVYYGPKRTDKIYERISKSFDRFFDINTKSDKDVAIFCRNLKIDIAIDLTGHTRGGRVGIFSYRVAKIQMSYLGYLGTMGAKYYDYLIADEIIIPKNYQKFYTEKILYLPHYLVNDPKRNTFKKEILRSEFKIPDKCFVYSSFNNNYKINPTFFKMWMKILESVDNSYLLIYFENNWAKENLKKEAKKNNIDLSRIIFIGRVAREEYFARLKLADLCLDTSPYNGATTSSDALWIGLPVLTCIGKTFSSRICASILNAVDLNEMICDSEAEYVDMAIELGRNKEKYLKLKNKLNKNIKNKPLFNPKLFSHNIENLFKSLHTPKLL